MKIAEFTALLFLLTQFTIPANATPGWPTLPCSIFHPALLLLHASKDAGATEMPRRNKAAQAETWGPRPKRETLNFPLLHLCGLCYCAGKLESSSICFLAKDKQNTEFPSIWFAIQSLEGCNCLNMTKFCKALTIIPI